MRRQTRRGLINLTFFASALTFIIYLNRPQSNPQKTHPWNKIRYKTTSTTLPKPHGICPGLADSSKPALVVASLTTDSSTWLDELSSLYHICVYKADAPTTPTTSPESELELESQGILKVPANRGHESMTYLTFLIDNYDEIPAAGAVFIHGDRFAWHNDSPFYDNLALLRSLNIPSALAHTGYHNLRCDWSTSMCDPKTPAQGSLENSLVSKLEPWNDRVVSDAGLVGSLGVLFGEGGLGLGRTEVVRAQCCAQFVVGRENIWMHSREEYIALRQWLLDGSSTTPNNHVQNRNKESVPPNDRVTGRILSYIWHILFMKLDNEVDLKSGEKLDGINLQRLNEEACPSAEECYCRLYGRCDLKGCYTPARCKGQYSVPSDFRLPENWAAMHS